VLTKAPSLPTGAHPLENRGVVQGGARAAARLLARRQHASAHHGALLSPQVRPGGFSGGAAARQRGARVNFRCERAARNFVDHLARLRVPFRCGGFGAKSCVDTIFGNI